MSRKFDIVVEKHSDGFYCALLKNDKTKVGVGFSKEQAIEELKKDLIPSYKVLSTEELTITLP